MRKPKENSGFLHKLGIVLIAGLLLGSCSGLQEKGKSPAFALSPITNKPSGIYHPGKFVWHDLLTTDEMASRTFYGELLGWTFRNTGNQTEIYNGEHKIGGMLTIAPRNDQTPPAQWLSSMSVQDVKQAAAFVRTHGGKIINGPMSLGDRGEAVLISDPGGAQLLLLQAAGGDPRDLEPGIGDWLWNEVWTLQPDPVVDFYKSLGRYEETLPGEDYVVMINEGVWRAGVRTIKKAAYAGRWIPAIRVENPVALLEKVRHLGGVVWRAPGEGDTGNDTALIADNKGAMLILQRWDFTTDKKEN